MYFGLHLFGHHSPEVPPDENFRRVIDQVRTAREAGFDLIWSGHHYMVDRWQKFQVIPSTARLAGEAGNMHVGTALLLPLHHPVVIAEQFATLDAITGGRIILAPVAGYRDVEFETLGIPKNQRFTRLVEGVEAIKQLWMEDNVTFEGEHFHLPGVSIHPKPIQDPHPPIWVGANADRAVKRASEIGDAWLINPHADEKTIRRQVEFAEPPSGEGFRGVQPSRREVFVAETDEEALEIYGTAIQKYYEYYDEIGQGDAMEDGEALTMALDELQKDRFIIGSPETVADGLVNLNQNVGLDCVIMAMHMPGLDHEDTLRSIELTGETVIPQVLERLGSK